MKTKTLFLMLIFAFSLMIYNPLMAQAFDFNDGTIQNWTIDQIYETDTQTKKTPAVGFVLHNDQNQLAATADPLVIGGGASGTYSHDIYLESPDLSSVSAWQNISGYSIDILRTLRGSCGEPGGEDFFAQLQLRVIDTSDNSTHVFAEYDGSKFVFHRIDLSTPYHFVWKPSFLSDAKYQVKNVRIRLLGAHDYGSGECAAKGSWIIDNVNATGGTTGNTNPGANVQVDLGSGVNATFDNVTDAGNTSMTTSSSGTPPPEGFQIIQSGSPVYYNIETTATFTGNIEICITYNDAGMTSAQEAALQLQVYENPPGQWTDITTSLNTTTNIICGTVNHLSEFAVMFSSGAPDIAVVPLTVAASVDEGKSTVETVSISNTGDADLSFSISGTKWQVMPGTARDIGVGADGETWVIGTDKIENGYGIYRWNGMDWDVMPGGAMTIDVGSQDQVVVVNETNDIYKWDGSDWQPLPGKALQVSVASDGSMWAIGANKIFGGYEILKWNGTGWNLMPGGAVKIGVGSQNHIWCVSEFSMIYRWNGSDWDLILGVGSDVSVGSDGSVWVVSTIATTGGNEIFLWNGADWAKQPGGAVAISVGSADHIWDVNDVGEIFRWNSSGSDLPAWLTVNPSSGTVIPGSQQDIMVTFDAAGLTPDMYSSDIFISSNDFDEPIVTVPVTLEVLPSTVVDNSPMNTPIEYALRQNYPNPFNPATTINYQLSKNCHVTLKIFNTLGHEVVTLVDEQKKAGYYSVQWKSRDITSGFYFYYIKADGFTKTRKMILLR